MVASANESLYRAWASRNRWSEDLRCDCDEPATFSISRTDENPGKSFRDAESSEADVGDDGGYVRDASCTVSGGKERLG
ncbi:hypothetical protein LXL04_009096 [Taraxacum kok-saghyz]